MQLLQAAGIVCAARHNTRKPELDAAGNIYVLPDPMASQWAFLPAGLKM
jgi:hypothetical protein